MTEYDEFKAADHEWSAELKRLFGRNAGDVRYTKQGEGEPGTTLNACYLRFRRANDAWLEWVRSTRV